MCKCDRCVSGVDLSLFTQEEVEALSKRFKLPPSLTGEILKAQVTTTRRGYCLRTPRGLIELVESPSIGVGYTGTFHPVCEEPVRIPAEVVKGIGGLKITRDKKEHTHRESQRAARFFQYFEGLGE